MRRDTSTPRHAWWRGEALLQGESGPGDPISVAVVAAVWPSGTSGPRVGVQLSRCQGASGALHSSNHVEIRAEVWTRLLPFPQLQVTPRGHHANDLQPGECVCHFLVSKGDWNPRSDTSRCDEQRDQPARGGRPALCPAASSWSQAPGGVSRCCPRHAPACLPRSLVQL